MNKNGQSKKMDCPFFLFSAFLCNILFKQLIINVNFIFLGAANGFCVYQKIIKTGLETLLFKRFSRSRANWRTSNHLDSSVCYLYKKHHFDGHYPVRVTPFFKWTNSGFCLQKTCQG
jgi:hypothetical protein